MEKEGDLESLIRKTEAAIGRLDAVEKGSKLPLMQRLAGHMRRNGGNLASALLAASVLAVAVGRLNQKYEYQVGATTTTTTTPAPAQRCAGGRPRPPPPRGACE